MRQYLPGHPLGHSLSISTGSIDSVHDALETANSQGTTERHDKIELLGVRSGMVGTTDGGRLMISLGAGTFGRVIDDKVALCSVADGVGVQPENGDDTELGEASE